MSLNAVQCTTRNVWANKTFVSKHAMTEQQAKEANNRTKSKKRARRGKNQSISYKNFLSSFTFFIYICRLISLYFFFCFSSFLLTDVTRMRGGGGRQKHENECESMKKMLYCHYNSKFEFFTNSFVVKMAQRVFTFSRELYTVSSPSPSSSSSSLLTDKFPISVKKRKLFHPTAHSVVALLKLFSIETRKWVKSIEQQTTNNRSKKFYVNFSSIIMLSLFVQQHKKTCEN